MSLSMRSVVWLKKTHRSSLPACAAGSPSLRVWTSVPWSRIPGCRAPERFP